MRKEEAQKKKRRKTEKPPPLGAPGTAADDREDDDSRGLHLGCQGRSPDRSHGDNGEARKREDKERTTEETKKGRRSRQ